MIFTYMAYCLSGVLIETLWNVKSGSFCPVLIVPTVLIETLWNVKKVGALIIFRNGSRINRNIVECKETGVLTQPVNPGVLIETLWNVKMCSTYSAQPLLTVLIETLWNVKLGLL